MRSGKYEPGLRMKINCFLLFIIKRISENLLHFSANDPEATLSLSINSQIFIHLSFLYIKAKLAIETENFEEGLYPPSAIFCFLLGLKTRALEIFVASSK